MKTAVKLSPEFRSQTTKAITSIVIFALTYGLILGLAMVLTGLCVYFAIQVIILKPTFVTAGLGIGLASLGVLVLVFLIKFIFKSNKFDRSHLQEVTREQQPRLFAMIEDIVGKVETDFPKKVYLSQDVNASVFYDSSFWSMILPVRKNLQIGLGLVNTVTESELKAILSHEFGHFSQKTMKVGSYVYYVNHAIYNMLYDNESYETMMANWYNASGYFSFFVIAALKIVQGIQWILRKLYTQINKHYLGLSREMEFHADEIAATVTGYEPLKESLLRLPLADLSLNNALNFYASETEDPIKTANIYQEQQFIMNFLAERDKLPIIQQIPMVTLEDSKKFNKSKLQIKDQWASHPSTEDRILRMEQTQLHAEDAAKQRADQLFEQLEILQQQFTARSFEQIDAENKAKLISFEEFKEKYVISFNKNSFPIVYNSYYDNKTITQVDIHEPMRVEATIEELFSDAKVNLVYEEYAIKMDIGTLKQIAEGKSELKTFDYDGIKYAIEQSEEVANTLAEQLPLLEKEIIANDTAIYWKFKQIESEQQREPQLERLYTDMMDYDAGFETKYSIYIDLLNGLNFLNTTTEYQQIKENLQNLKPLEESFKTELKKVMDGNANYSIVNKDIHDIFEKYLEGNYTYFDETIYLDNELNSFFHCLHNYAYSLSILRFQLKKKALDYQESLINNEHPISEQHIAQQNL
ncbi:M48 family metalloprotease [Sphingobacterium hungaricum]